MTATKKKSKKRTTIEIPQVVMMNDRLLLLEVKPKGETDGGLVLPDSARKRKGVKEGVVLLVGDGRLLDDGNRKPMTIRTGDRVTFGEYSGVDVEIDGRMFIMLPETEVWAYTRS